MMSDSYTKAILTIIALSLLVLVVQQSLGETSPQVVEDKSLSDIAGGIATEELSAYHRQCKCCSSSDAAIGAYVRQKFDLPPDWNSGDDGLSHFIVIFDGKGTDDSRNIRVGAVGMELRTVPVE
jgi:hypothetical protein